MTDQLIITAITVLSCLVIAVLGWLGLRLTRRGALRYQVIIASLTPVIAVAAAVVANVWLMFLSRHDSGVMVLALSVSLLLAAGLAWLVSRRIVSATTHLGARISSLAGDAAVPGSFRSTAAAGRVGAGAPAELAEVIDELELTRARLTEASERAQAAQQARQELVRHLSHDLRTPLAGLRAMAEALEDGMVSDVPLAMRQIRATVGRMDSLVGDLFELSRVQGGLPTRDHRPVALAELIIDVVDEADTAARRQGVRLAVEVPADDRLAISGDADALARAIGNLVANAIRHTDPGGTVSVRAGRGADGDVTVAVTDSCGGIPEPDLARVFEAGWRGDRSRSTPDGAGLGLAITRGVVESHHGRIDVSNVGPGCRFDLELPAPDPAR
jgi:signal transduction histidine kinase